MLDSDKANVHTKKYICVVRVIIFQKIETNQHQQRSGVKKMLKKQSHSRSRTTIYNENMKGTMKNRTFDRRKG